MRAAYVDDVAGARALALAKVPAVGLEGAVLYPVADGRAIVGDGAWLIVSAWSGCMSLGGRLEMDALTPASSSDEATAIVATPAVVAVIRHGDAIGYLGLFVAT